MVLNHCGVVPTVLRVLVPEVGDWNWEMESRTGCRDGSGKGKPRKGQATERTSGDGFQGKILSNASGGIYPRAREGF